MDGQVGHGSGTACRLATYRAQGGGARLRDLHGWEMGRSRERVGGQPRDGILFLYRVSLPCKPPSIGDIPLPDLITRGYLSAFWIILVSWPLAARTQRHQKGAAWRSRLRRVWQSQCSPVLHLKNHEKYWFWCRKSNTPGSVAQLHGHLKNPRKIDRAVHCMEIMEGL